ncbi:MAG: hypothetical protein Q7V62_16290 [Actinomycetota bacterium]|nr:hypothetical protein [Actinomycetota bacterium]
MSTPRHRRFEHGNEHAVVALQPWAWQPLQSNAPINVFARKRRATAVPAEHVLLSAQCLWKCFVCVAGVACDYARKGLAFHCPYLHPETGELWDTVADGRAILVAFDGIFVLARRAAHDLRPGAAPAQLVVPAAHMEAWFAPVWHA